MRSRTGGRRGVQRGVAPLRNNSEDGAGGSPSPEGLPRKEHWMSDLHTVRILDPVPDEEAAERLPLAKRLGDLRGRVVGFLDNGQVNTDGFLARLSERLRADAEVASIVQRRKQYWTKRAEPEIIDDLARQCDVVVGAWGS